VFCGRKEAQKSFPPELNWNTLANCVDKYLNSHTETMESELPTCEFGYGKYLIVPFWYASAAYQTSLVEPWFAFWRDAVEPKYQWRDQTRMVSLEDSFWRRGKRQLEKNGLNVRSKGLAEYLILHDYYVSEIITVNTTFASFLVTVLSN